MSTSSKKRKAAAAAEADSSDDDAVASPSPDGGIECISTKDMLPKDLSVRFWVEIDSPSFLRRSVLMAKSMLDFITLWLCNNTASYEAAKRAEEEGKGPCTVKQFSGIATDCMDPQVVSMTVARMQLSPTSVKIMETETVDGVTRPKEEIGITVSVKSLLECLGSVKDYQKMVIYQENPSEFEERSSDRLTILVVSTAFDSYHMEIPLVDMTATHETVKNWDMRFDLCMPVNELKDTIKRAAGYGADNIRFRIIRWAKEGLIFVISTESRSGALFRAFQVTYTTPLKKSSKPDVSYALEKLTEAQSLYNACDKASSSAVHLANNVREAEREVKKHLFDLYDGLTFPDGDAPKDRVCTFDSSLEDCEKEVRDAQVQIRAAEMAAAVKKGGKMNALDFLEGVDAMSTVEVATSFNRKIREAPFHKTEINRLAKSCTEYDAWFSVRKLSDMLKTPPAPQVQVQLPKESAGPIALRFDTGGGGYMSFLSFVLCPRVDQDEYA